MCAGLWAGRTFGIETTTLTLHGLGERCGAIFARTVLRAELDGQGGDSARSRCGDSPR